MFRVEARVAPADGDLAVALVTIILAGLQGHGSAVVRAAVGAWVRVQPVRTADIKHGLPGCAVLHPALDDLYPLQPGATGIFCGPQQELGAGARGLCEFTAHGNACRVGLLHPIRPGKQVVGPARPGKEAHADARPAGAKGLPPRQRIVQGLAGVLGGPDAGQSRRAVFDVMGVDETATPACLRRAISAADLAVVVVLFHL